MASCIHINMKQVNRIAELLERNVFIYVYTRVPGMAVTVLVQEVTTTFTWYSLPCVLKVRFYRNNIHDYHGFMDCVMSCMGTQAYQLKCCFVEYSVSTHLLCRIH